MSRRPRRQRRIDTPDHLNVAERERADLAQIRHHDAHKPRRAASLETASHRLGPRPDIGRRQTSSDFPELPCILARDADL
jgi:hypothetical protein